MAEQRLALEGPKALVPQGLRAIKVTLTVLRVTAELVCEGEWDGGGGERGRAGPAQGAEEEEQVLALQRSTEIRSYVQEFPVGRGQDAGGERDQQRHGRGGARVPAHQHTPAPAAPAVPGRSLA